MKSQVSGWFKAVIMGVLIQAGPAGADFVFRDRFENGVVTDSDAIPAFWEALSTNPSTMPDTHLEQGGRLHLTAGDSTGAINPANQNALLVSGHSTTFNVFSGTRQFRVRGLSFSDNGSGFPMDKARFRFALLADGATSFAAADAIVLQVRGDSSQVTLGYKFDRPNAAAAGSEILVQADMSAHVLTEFDLTLEPGEPGHLAYYLRLGGTAGDIIHKGSFPADIAAWSGPEGAARLTLFAGEEGVADPGLHFTVSMDRFEVLKPGS